MINKTLFILLVVIFSFNGCVYSSIKQKVETKYQTIKKDITQSISLSDKKSNLISKSRQNVGTILPLHSNVFSQENAKKGFYGPYLDSSEIPFGLFFPQQYNHNKKIILFIHGISGTPTQFSYIINRLDKTKFQPLVAFYPSGFRLEQLGNYLNTLLTKLQNKLHFKQVTIVAHSMGGLVAKSMINEQIKSSNLFVDKFISISTPWGGHQAANYGVKYTPVVLPVWNDMARDSEYLKNIYKTALPINIKHFLLFGYKGKSLTTDGNSDGVISLKSQLKLTVQDKATIVKGYDENHTSILKNKDLSNFINLVIF